MNQNNKANSSSSSSSNGPEDGNGTISIKLPNWDVLNEISGNGKAKQISSAIVKIGGLTWQVKIQPVQNDTKLNMFIHCNEAVKDSLWLCKVRFKVEAWTNGEEDKPFHSRTYGQYYGFNSHFWLIPIHIYYVGKLKQRPFEIKLEIKVIQVLETSLPTLDTALVVNMGERHSETLLVNKYSLATLSSYFRNLFFEDWSDKRKREGNMFELNKPEDFDIRAFKAMIYSTMTFGLSWTMQESNFLDYKLSTEIVKLAVKYDFPMMLDCCEEFLIEHVDNYHPRMDLLELADQFNLIKLKEECLMRITVMYFMKVAISSSWEMEMEEIEQNKQIFSRLSKATQEQLRMKLDGEVDLNYFRFSDKKMDFLEVADQLNLVKLKQHCLNELSLLDYMDDPSKNHAIHSRLSKATRKQLRAKLDGKLDFKECPHSKMDLLEVADRLNLVQLKQHCLDEMNPKLSDYTAIFSREGYSRLTKATREQLRAKLIGKAEELRDLAEQLKGGVESNKSNRFLIKRINKLAESVLGQEEEEELGVPNSE